MALVPTMVPSHEAVTPCIHLFVTPVLWAVVCPVSSAHCRSKKSRWFFNLFSFVLVLRMEWWLLTSLHSEPETAGANYLLKKFKSKKISIFYIYLQFYHFCCCSFLCVGLSFHFVLFPLSIENFLYVSYNVDLLMVDFLSFCLFENVSVSPWFLKGIFIDVEL